MKILIIEDEKKTAALLREALIREQYEVVFAFDGETGHAAALAETWDAMIVDIMLPGMNGLGLVEVYIRRLREKIDRHQPSPLIHTLRGLGYAMHLPPP